MTAARLRTALGAHISRDLSPKLAIDIARLCEASGAIDEYLTWDQLVSFWPRELWRPDVTPMAGMIPDCDSFHDAFLLAALAMSGTERLGVAVTTDAIRRGPVELYQTMLTLAGASGGRATLLIGAGEIKQAKPYGWKRSEGLTRLEDLFRIFRLLSESPDRLVDFDGTHRLLHQAWIGAARPAERPRIMGMGGGPKFLDLTAQYADGFMTAAPFVATSPERMAELVDGVGRRLAEHGRDQADFDFGILPIVALHEDETVVDKALDNPLLRATASIFGRFDRHDWEREGVEENVLPKDWHYAVKYLPAQMTRDEAEHLAAGATRQMTEMSLFYGSPEKVAGELARFVEAGVTWLAPFDLMPGLLSPEEAPAAIGRSIELCRRLKEKTGVDVAAAPAAGVSRGAG